MGLRPRARASRARGAPLVKVMGKKNLVIANIFCQSLVHSLNRGFTVVFSTSFGSNWGHFMRFSVPMTIENTKTGTNKD